MNILGVDVGSTMAKFVLIDKEKNICKQVMRKIQGNPKKCIEEIFYETSEFQNDVYIAVTGSSRAIIGEYLKANLIKSEILAHMYGVMQIEPAADLIFEIGGQDSKCIHINKGVISNFKMNSNCAAGTGAFIEAQARRLGLTLEELDSIALSAGNPRILNSKCAVFLESALINLQRNGVSGEDMAMTIFDSLARNYISSFGQNGIFEKAQKIVFVGGAAKFKAMKTAFEKNLNKEIVVLENCEYTCS